MGRVVLVRVIRAIARTLRLERLLLLLLKERIGQPRHELTPVLITSYETFSPCHSILLAMSLPSGGGSAFVVTYTSDTHFVLNVSIAAARSHSS